MQTTCFHCQEPVPDGVSLRVEVGGVSQPLCCGACLAAVQWIHGEGLGDYYRLRTEGAGPERAVEADHAVFDREAVQAYYAVEQGDGLRSITLAVGGMRCAACTWLIERAIGAMPGVHKARVHALTQRVQLVWDPRRLRLSELAARLSALGYRPQLADPARDHERMRGERREAMKRLVVGGVGMMQAMMYGVALYAGAFDGMQPEVRDFFRWLSMAVAAPVVFYAGQGFFLGAWREWQARRLGMDTPVALALGLAFIASVWEAARGGAEVYFDSVTMFVFFLLLGRFAEQQVRHRAQVALGVLSAGMPPLSRREGAAGVEEVATLELAPGDVVQVAAGSVVPVDGDLLDVQAELDEAMLSGESRAVARRRGEPVLAGSVALSRPLRLRVQRTGAATVISALARLADSAQAEKPARLQMAERVAQFFIARILVLTVLTALAWCWIQPERAFEITLAVLVVACPCALSLAMPTALAAASQYLSRHGVLVLRGAALETLSTVRHVALDKTGTLSDGSIRADVCWSAEGAETERLRCIAASLEQGASHPIARAIAQGVDLSGAPSVEAARQLPGDGVEGRVDGRLWRLGRPAWAAPAAQQGTPGDVLLACEGEVRLAFALEERPRADALAALQGLRELGLGVTLLSGDSEARVSALAAPLGIRDWQAERRPADKIAALEELQALHGPTLMVGDGVNDAPVLGRAAVSMAMGQGADLAKAHADLVLLGERLLVLPQSIALARRTLRTIRHNIWWAYGYNAIGIPAAALGYVPPWLAAIGMSLSSVIVVWNSMRLLDRAGGHEGTRARGHEAGSSSGLAGSTAGPLPAAESALPGRGHEGTRARGHVEAGSSALRQREADVGGQASWVPEASSDRSDSVLARAP